MQPFLIFIFLTLCSLGYGQSNKKSTASKENTATQETIFQLRTSNDLAVAVSIQNMLRDTCRSSVGIPTFIISGRILKKYFDKTGKFKEQKITYLSSDTNVYSGAPHSIVFLSPTLPQPTTNCIEIKWSSKPGSAFIFSPKTEAYIAKKKDK